jgi:hypothetical protein
VQILYLLPHLFKLYIYELIQISNTKIMDNQKYKLEKLKKAQKAKSSRDELFNSYLDKTTKVEDKIALVKFKQKDNNSVFLSSLKTLMKQ